jgi:transposase-like protein
MMPRAERLELIRAYRASGQTMAEFARREALNYSTFAGWVIKAGKAPGTAVPIKFAEVQLPALRTAATKAPNELEVRLPDGTVLRGGRVADLVSLVRALRS